MPTETPPTLRDRLRRWLLAGLGIGCVGVGAVGVVLPGLPTTIFLIAAAACFTRSCPWLEDKLLRHRLFAPYLRYVYGDEPMPRRARLTALAMMWTAVSASLLILNLPAEPMPLASAVIVLLALVGTVVLLRWRRPRALSRT